MTRKEIAKLIEKNPSTPVVCFRLPWPSFKEFVDRELITNEASRLGNGFRYQSQYVVILLERNADGYEVHEL